MSFIKRVTATLSANLDQAISRIENHDAVIEAALQDTRDAAARLKVQLGRVRNEGARLREEAEECLMASKRWTERAKSVASDNEPRDERRSGHTAGVGSSRSWSSLGSPPPPKSFRGGAGMCACQPPRLRSNDARLAEEGARKPQLSSEVLGE